MMKRKVYCLHYSVYAEMSTDVLSVRVRRELKVRARELGIDVRRVVEKALEEEIERVERERLGKMLEAALEALDRLSDEDWVKAVKEARLER